MPEISKHLNRQFPPGKYQLDGGHLAYFLYVANVAGSVKSTLDHIIVRQGDKGKVRKSQGHSK